MSNFINLVKLQTRNLLFSSIRHTRSKGKQAAGMGFLAFIGGVQLLFNNAAECASG